MDKQKMILVGSECVGCKYLDEIDNSKVYCNAKGKTYYYGQCIPCEERDTGKKEDSQ